MQSMDTLKEVSLHGGQVRFIPVELTAEWMGNAAGTQLSLNHITAEGLKNRGVAIFLSDKKDEDKGADGMKDDKKEAKEAKTKDIAEPAKDKMQKPSRQKVNEPLTDG